MQFAITRDWLANKLRELNDTDADEILCSIGTGFARVVEPKDRSVVAKMCCNTIETTQYGKDEAAKYLKVKLGAIYGTDGENKDFADATPSGECWMQINIGRPAAAFFEPGESYYVAFTKAPKKP